MTMSTLEETAKRLCEVSEKNFLNPYTYISWPESESMVREQWFLPADLISIYGTELFGKLTDTQQKKLSFFEAINFFSLNIHGEKSLVEGLAHRLYSKELKELSDYLHHFLDEENKHMIYFGGFCQRYAGKVYRNRKMLLPREYAVGEEDFLFFARVMIFEEIVDVYNVRAAADERVEPTSRKINLIHHLEEARHLVFGRMVVLHLFEKYSPTWSAQVLAAVRQYLADYVESTWKEYYNPDVYKDAGLEEMMTGQDSYDLVEQAWNNAICQAHRRTVSTRVLSFLKQHRMITEEPAL